MKNLIADGCVISVTLSGTVAAGGVVIEGSVIGIAVTGGESGDTIAVNTKGAYTLDKVTGTAFSQGDRLLWDVSTGKLTKTTDTDTHYIGLAYEDAASGATSTVVVLMRPGFKGLPQSEVGTVTVADATGNTTGDINGVKDDIVAVLQSFNDKLKAAGVFV